MTLTRENWYGAVIARQDSGGYDPSGYIAVVNGDEAAIAHFSHCSCYGTATALCGDGQELGFNWSGTVAELVDMARRKADPDMPSRAADETDYDYHDLMTVYEQVLDWAKREGK